MTLNIIINAVIPKGIKKEYSPPHVICFDSSRNLYQIFGASLLKLFFSIDDTVSMLAGVLEKETFISSIGSLGAFFEKSSIPLIFTASAFLLYVLLACRSEKILPVYEWYQGYNAGCFPSGIHQYFDGIV